MRSRNHNHPASFRRPNAFNSQCVGVIPNFVHPSAGVFSSINRSTFFSVSFFHHQTPRQGAISRAATAAFYFLIPRFKSKVLNRYTNAMIFMILPHPINERTYSHIRQFIDFCIFYHIKFYFSSLVKRGFFVCWSERKGSKCCPCFIFLIILFNCIRHGHFLFYRLQFQKAL